MFVAYLLALGLIALYGISKHNQLERRSRRIVHPYIVDLGLSSARPP